MDISNRTYSPAFPTSLAERLSGATGRTPTLLPLPRETPELVDRDCPGILYLQVDATDVMRGILRVRELIPVFSAGHLLLLYPEWLRGFHPPEAGVEAGRELGQGRRWRLNYRALRRQPRRGVARKVSQRAMTQEGR